jgi:aryl-alcohol dehydrogenase-like predicted oxidoreductase
VSDARVGLRPIADRSVWPIGLGGALWSLAPEIDERRSIRTIHAALDAGVTLIDTARAYTTVNADAHNEMLVARALSERSDADDVLVVTKGGHFRIDARQWGVDGRPESVRANCEASLRALGVDSLGLYLLHWPDAKIPIAETMGAFAVLKSEGKIRAAGLSNVSIDQLNEASNEVEISAVENSFSAMRQEDRPMVDHCDATGIPYLAYSPLGGIGGATSVGELPRACALAAEAGISIQRLLLAWQLRQSPTMIPISGAGRPESAIDSAAAATATLSDAVWVELESEIDALNSKTAVGKA